MGAAPLSHDDRQVSIASCSNLVIDEQSSGTAAPVGGFPTATPSEYAAVEFGGPVTTSGGHPATDEQGLTPFVLASDTMKETGCTRSQDGGGSVGGQRSLTGQEASRGTEEQSSNRQVPQGEDSNKDSSSNRGPNANSQDTANKGKSPKPKRHHYNAYSSDDDDDVFLPNPPPKSQADRCTIAMETNEEKTPVVKEMNPSIDRDGETEEEGTLTIDEGGGDVINDHDPLGTVATETEGEETMTEEELDVVNDSRTGDEENPVNLSLPAANPGVC